MGQKADDLSSYRVNDATLDDALTDGQVAVGDEPDETVVIRQEIEQTRTEMSQTIDELQARLNPQHIVEQVKETVHDATIGKVEDVVSNVTETARNTSSGIMDTIKSNPIPAALLGASLGWILLQSGSSNKQDSAVQAYPQPYPYNYPVQPGYPTANGTPTKSEQPGMVGRFVETVKNNPIPAAVAGISIGYIMMQGQNQDKSSQNYQSQQPTQKLTSKAGNIVNDVTATVGDKVGQAGEKIGDVTSSTVDTVGNVAGTVGDTIGNVAGTVGDTISNVAGTVGDTIGNVAGTVGGTIGNVAGTAGDAVIHAPGAVVHQAHQAQNQLQRMTSENPLFVGAVAVAIGTAIGLLLPSTSQENQLLGEARDNLLHKAQDTVSETVNKVGTVAGNVVEEVQQTVSREVKTQGLLGNEATPPQQPDNPAGKPQSRQDNPQLAQQSSPNKSSDTQPLLTGNGSTPGAPTSLARPKVLDNMSSTDLEQLERHARQNDHMAFMQSTETFGWNQQTGQKVWHYMSQHPAQDEVRRAFETQGNQPQFPA